MSSSSSAVLLSLPHTSKTASSLGDSTDVTTMDTELSLVFREIRYTLSVSSSDPDFLTHQKELFLDSVTRLSDSNESVPGSAAELTLQYLQFLLAANSPQSIVESILLAFEQNFLINIDIHSLLRQLRVNSAARRTLLSTYYAAWAECGVARPRESALFEAAEHGEAQLFAAFGGQGTANPACVKDLADLNATYGPLLKDLLEATTPLINELSHLPETRDHYHGRHIDLDSWLHNPETIPDGDFISTAAVSFPVVGLLSLAQYCVTCKVLGKAPGDMRSLLEGVTGHSQGMLVATGIAIADSWESFYDAARTVVQILFWIGYECHQGAPRSSIPVALARESQENGEGQPSCMLSVRGIQRSQIEAIINKSNKALAVQDKLHLALANARDNFVVAGPACSLVHFNSLLRSLKAEDDVDQGRTPFSRRKPTIQHQFLPISAPFHTPHLKNAATKVKNRLLSKSITADQLMFPVYHSKTGQDLRELGTRNIIDILVDSITCELGDWPTALDWPDASHIIVFGGGGIGELVKKIKDGQGIRVIIGSEFEVRDDEMGAKVDLFSRQMLGLSTDFESWGRKYQPSLMQSANGGVMLDTKLSRLLGTPPVMVGGMTPTTVHWDFVSAIMNAGYHVELAGGGYYNAEAMSAALAKLIASVPVGRGVTINLIYASPQAMAWQIAMLRRFAQSGSGIPIDGLTIGAGVPSPSIVAEWINTLALKHIAFKPGSLAAIQEVIEIALAHPDFPIILQWTGGRGGGHHSFEDFHAPILSTYGAIRKCSNVVLVAGSGFGGSEDTYPYLTGTWTQRFGASMALMPFDGILLGSRMMVAKEAHTSPEAKKLIFDAPGVADSAWENSYSGPTGGVITVQSEMGQPIHKIATRGVLLWAELDNAIFRLPRKDRVAQLQKRRDYIIRRLNADFARPWFGQNSEGEVVDLADMTYAEVLERMISLMHISHQDRWVDISYARFILDFAARTLERLPTSGDEDFQLPASASTFDDPYTFVLDFISYCPEALTNILNPEDVSFFLLRCKARGSKPVNFIPSLDDDFEVYFKKDSLWQSEDVDAVIGRDAGRICILHGPVAAKHSTSAHPDESVQDILDGIAKAHVEMVRRDFYPETGCDTPRSDSDSVSLVFSSTATPRSMRALLSDKFILQGHERKPSPFHRLLQLNHPRATSLNYDPESSTWLQTSEDSTGAKSTFKIVCQDEENISVELHQPSAHTNSSVVLPFTYRFNPGMMPFGLSEIMERRNARIKSFYSKIWFGEDIDPSLGVQSQFLSQEMTLTKNMLQDLVSTVGHSYYNSESMLSNSDIFPISIGILVAWDVITKPLVLPDIDGDLLKLVHQSNTFKYCADATPLRIGDVVIAQSRVKSIYIEEAGKFVVVEAQIKRASKVVMLVTSTFLFKGSFTDFESTFKESIEEEVALPVMSTQDEAILRDLSWFIPSNTSIQLFGKTLLFKPQTKVTWRSKKVFESMTVNGPVFEKLDNELLEVGIIDFKAIGCIGNPVVDFLARKGTSTSSRTNLKNAGWSGDSSLEVQVPADNEMYARVSKDYNPIHVSPIFSQWAELPGTITHGMYTSAIAAGVLEYLGLNGDRLRFRQFSATFTGMVLPSDKLIVRFKHTGMTQGRMIFKISAFKKGTDDMVLDAEAEVEQATTTYVFTGQGSQSVGIGMDLYNSSPIAKSIWDNVDKHLQDVFGWSILDIVRNNPTELTIHFGGKRGRKILANYLAMETESTLPDGRIVKKPILKGLTKESRSYTFSESRGLLFSTQFAQPSILLLQTATIEDMRAKGLVQENAIYAGHSLGEYGSLSAFSGFMSIKTLVEVVFYRGLTMQTAMERDQYGETNFSMVAVNPKRAGKFFNEVALRHLVNMIASQSDALLEIVNFNVEGEQYVCAGNCENLHVLSEVLNHISKSSNQETLISESLNSSDLEATELSRVIAKFLLQSTTLPRPIQLHRGIATIPLKGIDVPFHSSHLRNGVQSFRRWLLPRIREENVHPEKLVGRFVPNVMATPFSLDLDYVKEAERLTGSPILKKMLEGINV